MSYIQLPYGLVRNEKQLEFNLPKNYEESQYIKRLPYIRDKGTEYSNSVLNRLRNRDDLKEWLLATSDYGHELQEDLNAIVGCDEKVNNAIVRHALNTKNAGIFHNPNPINLTFCDVIKLYLQNPIIGKIVTQVKASKLTDEQLTKIILMQDDIINIENRLEKLRRPVNINYNSDDEPGGPGGGGGGDGGRDDGTPPRPPTRTRRDDGFDELTKRLNRLRAPAYPPKPPKPNPRGIDLRDVLTKRLNRLRYGEITPSLEEKTLATRLAERNMELVQLPKGAAKARKSNLGLFQPVLSGMSPPTPDRNYYWLPPPFVPADNNFV